MKVRLLLFAGIRELAGTGEISFDLPDGSRPSDVWKRLQQDHPRLNGHEFYGMTAINQVYAAADTLLHDGDELAFIPPVAGG